MTNPYQSPTAVSSVEQGPSLYSPGQVAWASFLGAPIAGCLLIACNYSRIGHAKPALGAVVCGAIATIAVFAVSFLLPDNFPNMILPAAYTFGMLQATKSLQGTTIERHLANGGAKASGWIATGIGLLCLIGVLIAIAVFVVVIPEGVLGE